MADVKFLKGSAAAYEALVTKDPNTFYFVGGEDLYLGTLKLTNADDIISAIEALDGNVTGTGSFVKSISQTDGVVTATLGDISVSDVPDLTLSKITDAGTAAGVDTDSSISEGSTSTNVPTSQAVASFVSSQISGLTGAMHFRGVVTRASGETDAEAIANYYTSLSITPESGDVVVMSDNAKEYVYATNTWREVGDESSFVKKTTTIAGVDLNDNITASELREALNVSDGAEENVIDGVNVNGTALTPDVNKQVNVTVTTGSTDGTISVNGTDVSVYGLGSAAYASTGDFDADGSAAAVQGQTTSTVKDVEDLVGAIPSTSQASTIVGYVDEQVASATVEWEEF